MQKVSGLVSNCIKRVILVVFIVATIFVIPQVATAQTSKTITLSNGTKYATKLYVIDSGVPGPVVMIVGGVHGNETAGYKAAYKVKSFSIKKGKLLVVPYANLRAVKAHTRSIGGADLNRDFPRSKYDSADNVLSKAIFNVVKKYNVDWVMDMHEGANYERIKSSSSVGQSLIYYPDTKTKVIASKIVSSLNKGIATSYKDFSLLRYPVSGSLAKAAAVACGANSFIFETCSRDPLATRVNYQLKAANMLLDYLNMK